MRTNSAEKVDLQVYKADLNGKKRLGDPRPLDPQPCLALGGPKIGRLERGS